MNPAQKRMLHSLLTVVVLCSMFISMLAPLASLVPASAQEVTEEPSPEVTETAAQPPTEMPTETPTEAPTEPPLVEVTQEPTAEVTQEPTAEVTQEPTVQPTDESTDEPEVTEQPTLQPTPPADSLFQEDFQDGDTSSWILTPGWQVITENTNLFLRAATPGESATISGIEWAHLLFSARLLIDPTNAASVSLRKTVEDYTITLDGNGRASLYRSGVLLAQGAEPTPVEGEPTAIWRTLNIYAQGGTITVGVDSAVQFTYSDPTPLGEGAIVFSADALNTGAVAFDDVVIHKLEAPVIVATPTPEVTQEATQEATEEATPETTPEPDENLPILSADFEGEVIGWTWTENASIVAENETNSALLMAASASLAPTDPLYLGDFQIDARANLVAGTTGGLNINFRSQEGHSYTLSLETAQTTLWRDDGEGPALLTTVLAEHAANTWHTLNLKAQGGVITATVNGVVELAFNEETPLLNGQIAFSASGDSSLMLDDIAVIDLTPGDLLITPTPTPDILSAENALKLDGALYNVVSLYVNGDEAGAQALAANYFISADDLARMHVVVWAGDGFSTDDVTALIETTGGTVGEINENQVNAYVSLASLVALANTEIVSAILLPERAISTSSNESPAPAPAQTGTINPHSLDIIGWNDWNLAGITGSAVKVGVVDLGFSTAASAAGDRSCFTGMGFGSAGSNTHGMNMVEVICDIARNANVKGYTATNSSNMDDAINKARTDGNRVIVIAMDLGAHVSPGDGTGGGNIDAVYTAINNARNAGALVIASAGNNNQVAPTAADTTLHPERVRYVTLDYTGTTVNVPIHTSSGDLVNISWSAWSGSGNLTSTLQGVTRNRTGGGPPGYQFTVAGSCGGSCDLTLEISNGGSYSVQVQVTGDSYINSTGLNLIVGAGNLARPADSPNVLAVGAVCSLQAAGYPALPSSSHGPIFTEGGVLPVDYVADKSRNTIKPDLVAPSFVETSALTPDDGCFELGIGAVEPASGFNGTSASAAHVAGMTALLIANTNASMNAFDAANETAVQAMEDYLQTHSMDLYNLPGVADGYDITYGAGLTTLGNPNYDLSNTRNPTIIAQANTFYVGLANPGTPQNGTPDEPYMSIAQAVAIAANGQDVIVMPGEYVASMIITNETDVDVIAFSSPNAFNSVDPDNPNIDRSFIWVNDTYQRNAGIYLEDNDGVSIDGFVFHQATPANLTLSGIGYNINQEPPAIRLLNTSNSSILNNTFTGVGSPNNGFGDTPVQIGDENNAGSGGQGNVVLGNTFNSNKAAAGALRASALVIAEASNNPGDTPTRVELNTFSNNGGATSTSTLQRESIVDILNSGVEIFSNRFMNNIRESVIRVSAPSTNYEVQMFSNAFQSNFLSGPVVHLDPGLRFRFINNTVVGNNLFSADLNYQWIILRGNQDDQSDWINGGGEWELHNNIVFDNPLLGGFVQDQTGAFTCDSIVNAGVDDSGAKENWLWSAAISGSNTLNFGDCESGITNPANNNIININPNTDPALGGNPTFVGSVSPTDPYQIKQNSTAVDRGVNSLLTAAMQNGDDAVGNDRIRDGDTNPDVDVDLGAYELTPLTAGPIDTERLEDTFNRPGDQPTGFRIDLRTGVEGGFPPFQFFLKTPPENFSTNPLDTCNGAGVRIQGNFAYFCPPPHFYTRRGDPSNPGAQIVPDVTFEYYVTDTTYEENDPLTEFDTVTVTVFETADLALSPSDAVTYRFLAEADTPFNLRMRPSVSFNNFSFSESGTAREFKADYPFTYSNVVVQACPTNPVDARCNIDLFNHGSGSQAYIQSQVNSPNPDGSITLDPMPNELGYLIFTYTAADSHTPQGSVTNTLRLEVVGAIPDRGLHDDASFSFLYENFTATGPGKWAALYSETSINNTLHQTKTTGDTARFLMIGQEFTLYMSAISTGGLWELKIDDFPSAPKPPMTWVKQASGEWRGTIPGEGFSCTTRAPLARLPNTTNPYYINNKGTGLYTVSCIGLRDGEAHEIKIINKQNKVVNVDALSLSFVNDPMLPGFHEVNEPEFIAGFPSWTFLKDTKASSGMALVATSSSIPDARFTFTGTGFAIGTTLERRKVGTTFQGAAYNICVTPEGGQEVCQSFNNNNASVVWNVFRPFYGFDPNGEHDVRIDVTSIPAGGRLVIDSIRVFDTAPTAPLALGTTENDVIGPMVFSNGRDDSWVFNTRTTTASNSSLHTISSSVGKVGPFVSFQIPDAANVVQWFRVASTTSDTQQAMVCLDRAQGEAGITNHCVQVNLRTAPNPYIISENLFAGGWGTAWGTNTTHTVEIFSLANNTFNMDKVIVLNTDGALPSGYYEERTFEVLMIDPTPKFGLFNPAFALNGGAFVPVGGTAASKTSGKRFIQTNIVDDGVFFQMTGTGFSAYFTQDKVAGNVEICWTNSHVTTPNLVGTANCRIYNNFISGTTVIYQIARSVVGLSETPGNYSVTIRNKGGTMKFDALEVYGALPGTVLEVGPTGSQRYETSFTNRVADDRFGYFGTGWRSVSGSSAKTYSGSNYDTIVKRIGAGFVFRTNGADVVQIGRLPKSTNASIQVCIDDDPCLPVINNTLDPVVINLPDKNAHTVAVTLASNSTLILDFITLMDSDVAMGPGSYEDNYPLLSYDNNWSNTLNAKYTNGRGKYSGVLDATLLFHLDGSFFQIGAFAPAALQMEACFTTGIVTNANDPGFDANCETWPPSAKTTRQIYNRDLLTEGVYTIRIRNKVAAKQLVVDYLNIFNGVDTLLPGFYEETHPKIQTGLNGVTPGTWLPVNSASYSGGSAVQTNVADDYLVFDFEGTGFQVGTATNNTSGSMLVCYEQGALSSFILDFTQIDQFCYTYNNLTSAANFNTSRTVAGLADNTYSVRVVNLTSAKFMRIDYVQIFDDLPPVAPVGVYNENATDSSGDRYLQLSPANRWLNVTGTSAAKFSGRSYVAVADANGRMTSLFAGPVATLHVNVTSETTVLLDTGVPSSKNTLQLLVCVDNVDTDLAGACQVITTLRTQQQHAINLTTAGSHTITFRALTPGEFKIDGFQVFEGDVLTEGIYDDPLMNAGQVIDLVAGAWQRPPTAGTRTTKAYGGSQIRTQSSNAAIDFDFTGTGLSIITQQWNRGINIEICYALEATFDGTWDNSAGETCVPSSTDIASGIRNQAGITLYGLPANTYSVRVRVADTTIKAGSTGDWLYIDAIAIFGELTDALDVGLYDNAQLGTYPNAVRFGPAAFWGPTTTTNGPTAGPWNRSDTGATNSGAVFQVRAAGNTLILYQTIDASTKNSNNVRVCLVLEEGAVNELQCSTFSQSGKKIFFSPIIFYGLGDGEHTVIFENRTHARRFNVDAVQVIP